MSHVIFIHGPSACGKTRNKDRIAAALNANRVFDCELPPPMDLAFVKDRVVILLNTADLPSDLTANSVASIIHWDDLNLLIPLQ